MRYSKSAAKEVQDISYRGCGGVPQVYKSPKIGGYRGLIKNISSVSFYWINYLKTLRIISKDAKR